MSILRKILMLFLLCQLAGAATAAVVKDVLVRPRGDTPVDPASVLAYVSVQPGHEVNRADLARDIKELEKSGRFSYVGTEIEDVVDGVKVIYVVQARPRISRLEITGADEIGNKKVRELLEVGAGDLVDDAILAHRALVVKDHYVKKYFPYAKLTWTIAEEKGTGLAVVRVKVDEGRRASVKRIDFEGNSSISARVLRKAMKQKQRNWLSWITGAGTYKADDLETDVETVRRVYQDHGFLDAHVAAPVLEPIGKRRVNVKLAVVEGSRYQLGQLAYQGMKIFPEAEVVQGVTNRTGDVASLAALDSTVRQLKDYYGSRGYISTGVRYDLTPQATNHVVDVRMNVNEGHLAYIRNINIRGNTRTRDKVIRREISVYPGEIFNEVKVRSSERRLRNLGYFGFVNSVPEETVDPKQYDLVYEVEEQKTGQFLVGAGFSSVDDLIGFAELSQGNFDLFNWPPVGGGQKLKLRGTVGTKREDVELSFVEPWFLDRKLSLGVNLFSRDRRYLSNEYDQRNVGFNVTLGRPLGVYNRVNLTYGLENIEVYHVDDSASDIIKAEEGSRIKSYSTLELVRDTRDSAFIPTHGLRGSVSGTVAGGPLAGDTDLYQLEAQVSRYWSVWFDHVVNLRGWASVVEPYGDSDRVPIFDRLFLGGARTLRGFRYREVGPKDENQEPIGGLSGWYATAEYTVPLVEKVRGAAFYDVGMVYDESYTFDFSNVNSDAGIGVRLDFPGFPIRLDYAWPLETDKFNDRSSGRFQFSIGYSY